MNTQPGWPSLERKSQVCLDPIIATYTNSTTALMKAIDFSRLATLYDELPNLRWRKVSDEFP
jgi:hypothetical protein